MLEDFLFAGDFFCDIIEKICGGDFVGEIEVGDYVVEWDDNKNKINKKKHGISFETAAEIFLDDYRIDDYDELHSDFEERIKTVGMVENIWQ